MSGIIQAISQSQFVVNASNYLKAYAPQSSPIVQEALKQFGQIALLYNLVDSGLANLLALETAKYGASILKHPKIYLFGLEHADTLTRDTLSIKSHKEDSWNPSTVISNYFERKYFMPQRHISRWNPRILAGLIPSIKFRFNLAKLNEISVNQNNKKQTRENYEINKNFITAWTATSASHIGIPGSLIQGLNAELFTRIKQNPVKCLIGAAQLTAAVVLTLFFYKTQSSSPILNNGVSWVANLAQNHPTVGKVALSALYFSTW